MHSDPESCLPMETEVHAIALDSALLASRRPLFAPCLPSTCSRACVQSPCGSLRFIILTVLNRGEVAVVGHCKFADMLYSSDELVVVVCFFSKTASILSTAATGQSVKSVYAFIHYAFGGVSATRASPLWCSTSASGPTRRVPPPRGSPPRCPSRAFPSFSARSSLIFFYEAFPHSEVRRLWALLWSGPLSLLRWVCVLFCGPPFAVSTSSGADGRVSRLRSSSPTAIVFSIPSLLCTCSVESQCTRAVGRVSRPRSSTWTYSFFVFLPFHCSRVCGSRVAPLCLPF